ncbi:MAG: family 78 glycoside hydrolase catalytic domain [Kiritimatiellae bacterium]|nr:family 78 glycoside hydrolase catalytic domain [Kiritimatiellia bacterium]
MRKMAGFALCLLAAGVCWGADGPYGLTCEYRTDPVGMDVSHPRLSWLLPGHGSNGVRQTAYRVRVASSREKLLAGDADMWDSGRVTSEQSVNVEYAGSAFASSHRYWWTVETWDNRGYHAVGEPACWVTGILRPEDWKAKWIGANPATYGDFDLHGAKWICPEAATPPSLEVDSGKWFFRRTVNVKSGDLAKTGSGAGRPLHELRPDVGVRHDKPVILGITGDDSWHLQVNGKFAASSWGHVYEWRWLEMLDVAGCLREGDNEIIVTVNNQTRSPAGVLCAFVFPDGRATVSDGAWEASRDGKSWSPVRVAAAADAGPWGKIRRTVQRHSPAFEKKFATKKPVASALLHITGVGFYEAELDGTRVGDKVLDPSPTKFDKRVLYSTYDVTETLARAGGDHTLRVLVGHGWYDVRAVAVWNFDNAPWRNLPAMIAQLEVAYADGTRETIVSDGSWRQVTSPIVYDDIREGELLQPKGREAIDLPVQVVRGPTGRLTAERHPGARVMQTLRPASVNRLPNGHWVVDFGQNMAGWVKLNISGQKKGDVVTIQYGEVKNADGSLNRVTDGHFRYPRSFFFLPGGWFQRDRFICSGEGTEVYEPRFTYNGFQYVEIDGLEKSPEIEAKVVHTAFADAGKFECSNELLNKIQNIFLWSYRSNFADGYPTDCPHREKNGWTGDAALASEMGQYNFQNVAAYEKWIQDILDEQRADGNIPGIVPTSGWGYAWGNGPAWDCSLTIIPWMLYVYNGDRRILETAYPGWLKYMNYTAGRAKNGLVEHGLGDWCPVKDGLTPVRLTSSGYFYLGAMIVARAAEILGKPEDAKKYAELAARIKDSVNKEMAKEDGIYATGSQCAQGCVLHQGLVSPELREKAAAKLVAAVERDKGYINFGILGSKYVFRALSEAGRTDLAYAMATKPDFPSFGDWIRRGATTAWEDFFHGSSKNHIMFGDISAWMYQYLAGIRLDDAVSTIAEKVDPNAVGFKRFLIAPDMVDGLGWVRASHKSPYGQIRSEWKRDGNAFRLEVEIPPNAEATVCLPAGATDVHAPDGVKPSESRKGRWTCRLGSGVYSFTAKL